MQDAIQLVSLVTARDKVVAHIDGSARASMTLALLIASKGPLAAYAAAVREALPDLAASLVDPVAERVERVMKARLPRMARRVRRARRAA